MQNYTVSTLSNNADVEYIIVTIIVSVGLAFLLCTVGFCCIFKIYNECTECKKYNTVINL